MIRRTLNYPVLFVAGHGRCGTTLIMTMLDAGGFPVTGQHRVNNPQQSISPPLALRGVEGGACRGVTLPFFETAGRLLDGREWNEVPG